MPGLFAELPRRAQGYVTAVVLAGTAAVVYSTTLLIQQPVRPGWIVLAGLTVLTGSFSINVPSVNARLSASDAFVFAAILSFGAHVATVIVALDALAFH